MINYEEFKKMELKIATIKEVKPHPQADKLFVLTIDIGGATRQLVAGIRQFYSVEGLVNKQIVVVANLEPAIIRGIESQGMLLAATDEKGISVLIPDRRVQEGSLVK